MLEWNNLLIDCSSHRGAHSSNWHIWFTSTSSRSNWVTKSQKVNISNRCFRILATITRDPGNLEWNTLLINCSSHRDEHSTNWHIWYTSTSSRGNRVKRSQKVLISNRCFVLLATITRDPGMLEWNNLLIDCSSHRGAHSSNWHIWYTSTSSRSNWVTKSQKVNISNRCFRILATITRDPGNLEWNTLLINCSSHRDEHSTNWHIWYTSTSSRGNRVTRSQKVLISNRCFVILATITRDPGMLEWNNLLIDCSSHRGAHSSNWHIWFTSTSSRSNWVTKSQKVNISNRCFRILATITRDPGNLEWNTLLINCSSHRDEHSTNWHIWYTSTSSRGNRVTRSQKVLISNRCFVLLATITRDPGMLEWNNLLIDCSSHRGAHSSNWHIWFTSTSSRSNWVTKSQKVNISNRCFRILATITRDPGNLEWNTLLINCSSHRDEHSTNWHIWYTSTSSRGNRVTRSQKVLISNRCFVILATITRDPGMLEWNNLLIDCSSHRGAHSSNWHIWSTSTSSRSNWITISRRYISQTGVLEY